MRDVWAGRLRLSPPHVYRGDCHTTDLMYDPTKRGRRSIRLRGWDYRSAGIYWVTICTRDHRCVFGDVVDQRVRLSRTGSVANECWLAIPDHHNHVSLDAFVVMPNHVHGLLRLTDRRPGEAQRLDEAPMPAGSLGSVLATYKAAVTRAARRCDPSFSWQRNYYERIVRSRAELVRFRRYVADNPRTWTDPAVR